MASLFSSVASSQSSPGMGMSMPVPNKNRYNFTARELFETKTILAAELTQSIFWRVLVLVSRIEFNKGCTLFSPPFVGSFLD